MGYASKGSSYLDIKNGTSITKTHGDKLKLFSEQLKSVFASKIDLKDKNLERETRYFFILNVQDYSPLKSVDDHEELISINELDMIIKNLGIKKALGLDYISNKLIKCLKPSLLKVLHFFFNLCINFGIQPANWKIAKVIILHTAGKPEAVGQKLAKRLINNKMVSQKMGVQMITDLTFLKQLSLVSVRVTQLQENFLMSRKPSTKHGMMAFFLS